VSRGGLCWFLVCWMVDGGGVEDCFRRRVAENTVFFLLFTIFWVCRCEYCIVGGGLCWDEVCFF